MTTSVLRLRDEALRFLRRFGLVAAVWSTMLAAAVPDPDGSVDTTVLWTGIAVLWAWAIASQVVRPPVVWWWGWLVAASGMELLGPLAGTDGWSLVGGVSFIVLAGVALTGRRLYVISTVAWLSAIAVARGSIADGWNVGGGIGTLLIFAFGALALAWLVQLIVGALEERDRLQEALLAAETDAARASERAEGAARLHDTVLQDLTAIGRARDLDEARRHAGRAQNQLRRFLRSPDTDLGSLRVVLEHAATTAADGVELSVGVVGDHPVGERERLLVDATAEAVRNAATHAASPIRVFAEAAVDGDVVVWVSDRGAGFDPATVPEDRLGVRQSIVGRLQRAGGTAELRSGRDGTEWELRLPPV
jgi:signal transduction histidine kinase